MLVWDGWVEGRDGRVLGNEGQIEVVNVKSYSDVPKCPSGCVVWCTRWNYFVSFTLRPCQRGWSPWGIFEGIFTFAFLFSFTVAVSFSFAFGWCFDSLQEVDIIIKVEGKFRVFHLETSGTPLTRIILPSSSFSSPPPDWPALVITPSSSSMVGAAVPVHASFSFFLTLRP